MAPVYNIVVTMIFVRTIFDMVLALILQKVSENYRHATDTLYLVIHTRPIDRSAYRASVFRNILPYFYQQLNLLTMDTEMVII